MLQWVYRWPNRSIILMAARYPWWRALTVRRKIVPESTNQDTGAENSTSAASKDTTKSMENVVTEETFQEDEFEPRFNQLTCRRNLRISRSGRFKEKRRVRAAIPESDNFHDGNVALTVAAK